MKFLLCLALLSSAVYAQMPRDVTASSGSITADSMIPMDAFEFSLAPLTQQITALAKQVDADYKAKRITKRVAAAKGAALQEDLALVRQSLAACAPDANTGVCNGDLAQAETLLSIAKAKVQHFK